MVTIFEIRPVRSSFCIILDTGDQYWLREEDLFAACIHEGQIYKDIDFQQLIRACQFPRALKHSVSLLARRPYSKKEIISRLIRLRYTAEVAELVVNKLEKENILNDEDFCEEWTSFRLSQHYGFEMIRRELKLKGISDEIITDVFNRRDTDEEFENALKLAAKTWKKISRGTDIRRNRQKVIASLVRKGYDWNTAKTACEISEKKQK